MIRINLPRQTLSLVGIVCGIWLVGCTQQAAPPVNSDVSTNNETTVNDTDRRKKVLTTFTVIADIAQNVAGDKLIVESITRIGAEIHGYEPTPVISCGPRMRIYCSITA